MGKMKPRDDLLSLLQIPTEVMHFDEAKIRGFLDAIRGSSLKRAANDPSFSDGSLLLLFQTFSHGCPLQPSLPLHGSGRIFLLESNWLFASPYGGLHPLVLLTVNVGFVSSHDTAVRTHKPRRILDHCQADPVAHEPRGFKGHSKHTLDWFALIPFLLAATKKMACSQRCSATWESSKMVPTHTVKGLRQS